MSIPGASQLVAVAGSDEAITGDKLFEPSIDRVYSCGALSTGFDPRETHEGFLIDFLFEKKRLCEMEALVGFLGLISLFNRSR